MGRLRRNIASNVVGLSEEPLFPFPDGAMALLSIILELLNVAAMCEPANNDGFRESSGYTPPAISVEHSVCLWKLSLLASVALTGRGTR